MSDLKAKTHKIRFLLGFAPDPAGGAYSDPPPLELYLRGLHLRGEKGKREEEGKGKGGERGREVEGRGGPPRIF